MKINKQKLLVSFCLIILLLNMLPFGAAYADLTETIYSEWMDIAFKANRIQMNALNMGIEDGQRTIRDWILKPFRIVANDFYYIPYTTPVEDIDEYFSRSKLTIRPNAVLIDDVPYTNIWLSKDAAEQFRINSFDIVTAFSIASESFGTFVEGAGTVCNIPVYHVGSSFKSPNYNLSNGAPTGLVDAYNVGDIHVLKYWSGTDPNIKTMFSATFPDSYTDSRDFVPGERFQVWVNIANYTSSTGHYARAYVRSNGNTINHNFSHNSVYYDLTPFDFDWVAGEIPVDEEIPDNYGLKVQIPTSYINNWLIDYGDTYTNQELTVNTTDTNLMVAIDHLLDIVNNNTYVTNTDIIINYGPDSEPVPPEPTPTPTPTPPPEPTPPMPSPTPSTSTDLIANAPWEWLENWLRAIRDLLRAIYEYVKQIVEYYLENIHADLFNLEQKLDIIIDKLEDMGDEIVNKLSLIYVDIGSILDDLIIDIEQAPIKLADKALDIFKLAFLPVLTRLRNALGIWHYVTEWLFSISAPFAYFINILSSSFPGALTPIYACVAGTLCILVYKRFGR